MRAFGLAAHGRRLATGWSTTRPLSTMEDLRIQYVLRKRASLDGPIAETDTHWIVLGFDATLDGALTVALRKTIAWLSTSTSLSQQEVYALCSIAGDFRVSQYSHQLNTVYSAKQPQILAQHSQSSIRR